MASVDQVADSEEESSSVDLLRTPNKKESAGELSIPDSGLSHRFREPPESATGQSRARSPTSEEKSIAVMVQGPSRPWEYQPFVEEDTVETVLAEIGLPGLDPVYRIEYEDGRRDDVSLEDLLALRNGRNALDFYISDDNAQSSKSMADSQIERSSAEPSAPSSNGKRARKSTQRPGFVNYTHVSSDDDGLSTTKKRRLVKGRVSLLFKGTNRRISSRQSSRAVREADSDSETDAPTKSLRSSNRTSRHRTRSANATRASLKPADNVSEEELADELAEDQAESDENIHYHAKRKGQPTRARTGRPGTRVMKGKQRRNVSESDVSSELPEPTRRSGRERIVKNMREPGPDEEIHADEEAIRQAKVISVREIFQPVSRQSDFFRFHSKQCDVCLDFGNTSGKGPSPLVYCQGCSSAVHKACLGYRSTRDHRVTKVGHENFVMQCRRCIGLASKKDPAAPRLNVCQVCKESGLSCAEFSSKKTSKQEEKLRLENDGDDPITEVFADLINNASHVLFRCGACRRAWHFEHLAAIDGESDASEDLEGLRNSRLKEYSQWQCRECLDSPGKVEVLVAWRPVDMTSYTAGQTVDDFREDQIEYLIKWAGQSYRKCVWMPGGWVWGVTMAVMRKAFFQRDDGAHRLPKFTFEDAVREDFLRMEIIFDVRYNDEYHPKSEKSDKRNIANVAEVLVKFQGLSYDDTVWDNPPTPNDGDHWSDFVAAYNEFLAGKYFKGEPVSVLKARVDNFRELDFVELKNQPSALVGGKIMDYQKEGMNWLLYNFHQQKNVILADEMGLGKTIQVIAFIAALAKHTPKCWPFLIVTPNSTCPNWRREIKKWAPDVRVVAYYGGSSARKMAMDYELCPEGFSTGSSGMRAHVVVTSYEAPVQNPIFFRKIKWAGMIVDEGQRLKNDENLLYSALKAMKTPWQGLLTGTPLQNNKRELFNLLQFCDPANNAADLDEEYEVLTKENLPKLHKMIQPYFLRRTKVQVLKDLPPMAQVIVPVTMSVVQKELYKSILTKNTELIQSLFDTKNTKILTRKDRGNLNNLLMQLRKCLCHPFMYSGAIEERSLGDEETKRNLIDASSKLQLLEIMLPKLQQRGHRVLLFSQFLEQLDLIEDFLSSLKLPYQRLDGNVNAMEKQRRIDAFNAPDSKLFAFLLSTRAGGVGINLATADTVIIMDPDFNPHQDIQAFSRAHRIGQKNKVLVLQLMTKGSAEEKIAQSSRRKMALDQVLIENMNAEDDVGEDLESILKHGAKALFDNDDTNDIRYDSASVDQLLDRTEIENTDMGKNQTAESRFSFARVWANDKGTLTEDIGNLDAEEAVTDPSVWDKILKARAAERAAEAARNVEDFGRGKRSKAAVKYDIGNDPTSNSPLKQGRKRRAAGDSEDDIDFNAVGDTDGEEDDFEGAERVNPRELEMQPEANRSRGIIGQGQEVGPARQTPIPPPRPKSSKEYAQHRRSRVNGSGKRSFIYDDATTSATSVPPADRTTHGKSANSSSSSPWQALEIPTENRLGQSIQHDRGHGQIDEQPTTQRETGQSFSSQFSRTSKKKVYRADSVFHDATRNGQNGGRNHPQSFTTCHKCNYPHLGSSFNCPHHATELQVRLMIDDVDHSADRKSQANVHYKSVLEVYLYRRCLEKKQAQAAQV